MNRLLLPVVLLAFVAACGGDDSAPGAAEGPQEMPFDVATAGNVSGMVMFEGTAPEPQVLDLSSEPSCMDHWGEQPVRENVRVANGHVANVFIYVKEGLEGMQFPVPGTPAVIDQQGCVYNPHITGVMTNQRLTFRNSDGLLHNINATPQVNRPFNISQPVNMETNRTFAQAEIMIPVRCDVHGWMLSYVGVVAHPYHATTGDAGTFDLSELPPGEYVIEAWHSQLGTLEQAVTVATGETAQVSFTFTEGMLASANVPMAAPLDPHTHNVLASYLERNHGTASTHDVHQHGEPATDLR